MRNAVGIYNRAHPLWMAYVLHRLSGVALAIFLPFHFWVLSLALTDIEKLDQFLFFTSTHIVKIVEVGLVFLLAVHMFGGLRLMVMEFLSIKASQKTLAAIGTAAAFLISMLFLFRAF